MEVKTEEKVVLVDPNNVPIGLMGKMEAHEKGLLHRAFSVFVFNQKAEMLLQKRADSKYHSPGLWTNTCCSHPRENESFSDAAHRRLVEEMGFDCELSATFHFTYKAALDQGLIEHEYDQVFIGTYEGQIVPNPDEVSDYRYISKKELLSELKENPESYTAWFRIIMEDYINEIFV